MKIIDTAIADVKIIEPAVFVDDRGFFMETWQEQKFNQLVCTRRFVQDNHSKSCQGFLRGLHYQTEYSQGKLVRVVSGEVFDVAVDIRRSSPTFGQWVGALLSAENKRQLWVPEGFSESAEFVYKCTDYYNPSAEHTIIWNDPDLKIAWPLIDGQPPFLSAKDKAGKRLRDAVVFD